MHKILKFRHRRFFTQAARLRLRYSVMLYGTFIMVSSLLMSNMHAGMYAGMLKVTGHDFESRARQVAFLFPDKVKADALNAAGFSLGMRGVSDALKKPSLPLYQEIRMESGDTVAGVLQEQGVSGEEAYYAVEALKEHFDPRLIKAGETIGIYFERKGEEGRRFKKLAISIDPVKDVIVRRKPGMDALAKAESTDVVSGEASIQLDAPAGDAAQADMNFADMFEGIINEKPVVKKVRAAYTTVENSLYGSAARAGIPSRVVGNLIKAYSWNIDFQRDIRKGDSIEVLYESIETEDGKVIENGNLLYANLDVGGRTVPLYRYEMKDGRVEYFDTKGHSLKRTLMKTPIDGARVSSGYGMRKHPVLGYSKMHKGVDFAARTGTPIYAAGNGVVEKAGRNGGYGNYIRIRHNGEFKTAYAHMSKFAKGIQAGSRVKQGDIIGYVGTTGRSTGPHLHYEVLNSANKQMDPGSVKVPVGEQLAGTEYAKFKEMVRNLDKQYAALSGEFKLALYQAQNDGLR